jgi:hypothetical protein
MVKILSCFPPRTVVCGTTDEIHITDACYPLYTHTYIYIYTYHVDRYIYIYTYHVDRYIYIIIDHIYIYIHVINKYIYIYIIYIYTSPNRLPPCSEVRCPLSADLLPRPCAGSKALACGGWVLWDHPKDRSMVKH